MRLTFETGEVLGFIENLREQKRWLLNEPSTLVIEGLIYMLDDIGDALVQAGYNKYRVFDLTPDDVNEWPEDLTDELLTDHGISIETLWESSDPLAMVEALGYDREDILRRIVEYGAQFEPGAGDE